MWLCGKVGEAEGQGFSPSKTWCITSQPMLTGMLPCYQATKLWLGADGRAFSRFGEGPQITPSSAPGKAESSGVLDRGWFRLESSFELAERASLYRQFPQGAESVLDLTCSGPCSTVEAG